MKKYSFLLIVSALFLAAAIGWNSYQRNNYSDKSIALQITENLAREMRSVKEESKKIQAKDWSTLLYPFYLISHEKITRWSKTFPIIDVRNCEGEFEWRLVRTSRTDLLLYKHHESDLQYLIGIIPLKTGYELVNQYLGSELNERIFPNDGIKILDANSVEGISICTPDGLCVFKIKIEGETFTPNPISVTLVIGALIAA